MFSVWVVMTSLSLIAILWQTILSNGFDWLTRLFCSSPNDDATLTVILKFAKQTSVSRAWERKYSYLIKPAINSAVYKKPSDKLIKTMKAKRRNDEEKDRNT